MTSSQNFKTADALAWDPSLSSYSSQEDSMLDTTTRGQITMQVNAVGSSPFTSYCVIDATDDNNFGIFLESFVQNPLTSTSRRAAMITKILQHNGEVVYRSRYWPLTVEEQANATLQQDMATFREITEECLGAKCTHAKLEEVGIPDTPEYVLYSDEDSNEKMFPDLDEESCLK